MFPQIDAKDGCALRLSNTMHQRVVLIVGLRDYEVGLARFCDT
jgi:hypothetical protein